MGWGRLVVLQQQWQTSRRLRQWPACEVLTSPRSGRRRHRSVAQTCVQEVVVARPPLPPKTDGNASALHPGRRVSWPYVATYETASVIHLQEPLDGRSPRGTSLRHPRPYRHRHTASLNHRLLSHVGGLPGGMTCLHVSWGHPGAAPVHQ